MLQRTVQSSRCHLELVTLYEICRLLGTSLDQKRSFRAALNVLTAHLEMPRAMIVLADEEGVLRTHSAVGLSSENHQRGQWKSGEGVIGRVHQSGMPIVVPDVRDTPEFLNRTGAFGASDDQRLAFIVVPMKNDQEVVGVLAAQREVEGLARLSDDQRVLTMVATLLAQSVMMRRAIIDDRERLQAEATRLQKALRRDAPGRYSIDDVIGQSRPMQQVFAEVHQAAPSRATVLLRGESGTGKEAIARAIHHLSPRKDAPFVKVNCAALSESLLESELFGHDKGAFTGATGDRKGRFEMAHGGTLFLDEIGDVSPAFQAKLLRVLQEREFERVGGNKSIKVDVRLVCATNRHLEKMVQRGEFRADLYYRINVVSIHLPALRERRDDIPALVNHFVRRFNRDNRRHLKVSPEAMRVLSHCYWPGNVRELENCIERTATMVQGDTIRDAAFPCMQNRCLTKALHDADKDDAVAPVREAPVQFMPRSAPPQAMPPASAPLAPASASAGAAGSSSAGSSSWCDSDREDDDGDVVTVTRIGPGERLATAAPVRTMGDAPPDGERERLIWAMEQCGWVQAKAARLLRVTPRQLGYALQRHRIEVRKF
jgi:Nif-specific regulatory protein